MELHEQPGQRLHRGNDAKAMPLPEPKGLGFPLLLGRGRLEGPKRRLKEGNDAHRRRRRPATALGFLPAIPSCPQSIEKHPGTNSQTHHEGEAGQGRRQLMAPKYSPLGTPRGRYDKHSSESSLSCKTKVYRTSRRKPNFRR
jgi:hypothetical protein